jgi:hypothetical protein
VTIASQMGHAVSGDHASDFPPIPVVAYRLGPRRYGLGPRSPEALASVRLAVGRYVRSAPGCDVLVVACAEAEDPGPGKKLGVSLVDRRARARSSWPSRSPSARTASRRARISSSLRRKGCPFGTDDGRRMSRSLLVRRVVVGLTPTPYASAGAVVGQTDVPKNSTLVCGPNCGSTGPKATSVRPLTGGNNLRGTVTLTENT